MKVSNITIRPAAFQDGKPLFAQNTGMAALINTKWTRDIHIDKVYKECEWLCVKTGDVVNRIRIDKAKEILKAITG